MPLLRGVVRCPSLALEEGQAQGTAIVMPPEETCPGALVVMAPGAELAQVKLAGIEGRRSVERYPLGNTSWGSAGALVSRGNTSVVVWCMASCIQACTRGESVVTTCAPTALRSGVSGSIRPSRPSQLVLKVDNGPENQSRRTQFI